MIRTGYLPYFSYRTFVKRFDDLFHNPSFTFKEKLKANRRGFQSKQYYNDGITDENYKEFLSIVDYAKLHPINGTFSHWIDDKLTIKYLLEPFAEFLPGHYYHFYQGELLKLPDCPKDYRQNIGDVIELLKEKLSLASKPLIGSSGQGFIKLGFM